MGQEKTQTRRKMLACFIHLVFVTTKLDIAAAGPAEMVTSSQYKLRQYLFNQSLPYDKNVRPVESPLDDKVEVYFNLRLNKIVSVNIKEQFVVIDTWINLTWKNPFFAWNPILFGDIQRMRVDSQEIWTPDVALHNKIDLGQSNVGGNEKFVNSVMIEYKGINVWSSPATFAASCNLGVDYWPFDHHLCKFKFGSISERASQLVMKKSNITNEDTNSQTSLGGVWLILKETHSIEEDYSFSLYIVNILMKRQSLYYNIYYILPCGILSILTLISFAIPCESGERIGFCITILLAMAVYLLMVAESVPETSTQVPFLGWFFTLTIMEIFFTLISTIIIVRLNHCSCKVSRKWEKVYRLLTFRVKCRMPHNNKTQSVENIKRENSKRSREAEVLDLETTPTTEIQMNMESHPHDSPENVMITWQDIAATVNQIMFCIALFCTIFICSLYFAKTRESDVRLAKLSENIIN